MSTRTRLGGLVVVLLVHTSSAAAQDAYAGMRLRSERPIARSGRDVVTRTVRPEVRRLRGATLELLARETTKALWTGRIPSVGAVARTLADATKENVAPALGRVWERRSSWRLRLLKSDGRLGAAARSADKVRSAALRVSGRLLRRMGDGPIVRVLDQLRQYVLGARPYTRLPPVVAGLSSATAFLPIFLEIRTVGLALLRGEFTARTGIRAGARMVGLVLGFALGGNPLLATLGWVAGEALGTWAERWYDAHTSEVQRAAVERRVYEAYGIQ